MFAVLSLVPPKYLAVSDQANFASHVRVEFAALIGHEFEVFQSAVVDVDHAALGSSGSRVSEERVDEVRVVVAGVKGLLFELAPKDFFRLVQDQDQVRVGRIGIVEQQVVFLQFNLESNSL